MRVFIEKIALDAGKLAMDEYVALDGNYKAKSTEKDIVTEADRKVEELIVTRIKERFPEHSIYGEETGWDSNEDSPFCWVIDPIDGTAAYEHGQFYYSVSIGLMKNNKIIAGAVYAPRLNELYYAEDCCGAFLNGSRIHVSDRSELINSTFVTGFACLRANLPKNNLKAFCAMAPLTRELRRYGSSALDFAQLAAGRIDFLWEYPLMPYDVAAGVIIVREAGGMVSDFDGGEKFPERGIAASNGLLHDKILSVIREHDYR